MSAQTVDLFDLDELPARDRWQRPLLIPKAGGERVAFTRMSSLSGFLTDKTALGIYNQRNLARGLALREDLCAMIAALPPLHSAKCDKKSLTRQQIAEDKAIGKKLDEYIEQALEAAGGSFKANHGTAVHGFIQNGSSEDAPERMQPDVDSCLETFQRRGIEILCSEIFVANDEIMAAGSFDHLARVPSYGVLVVDVKTGQVDGKGLDFAVQLAGYANAEVYDVYTDERAPLESLTGGERVSRTLGLVAHVPLGGGKTDLYLVNLRLGAVADRLAAQVRRARQVDNYMSPLAEEVA